MSQLKRLVIFEHVFQPDDDLLEFVEQLLPCGAVYWAQVGADLTLFPYDEHSMSSPMTHIQSLALPGARDQGVLKKLQFDRIANYAKNNMVAPLRTRQSQEVHFWLLQQG